MADVEWETILERCPLARGAGRQGVCGWCAKPLRGRKRRWCGRLCEHNFVRNHDWNTARTAVVRRDGEACVMCGRGPARLAEAFEAAVAAIVGTLPTDALQRERTLEPFRLTGWYRRLALDYSLEVDHIVPRRGQGYGFGCAHHLDELRLLCHRCHVGVTNQQREES